MLKCNIVGNHLPQLICDMDVAGKQFVLKQALDVNAFLFYPSACYYGRYLLQLALVFII